MPGRLLSRIPPAVVALSLLAAACTGSEAATTTTTAAPTTTTTTAPTTTTTTTTTTVPPTTEPPATIAVTGDLPAPLLDALGSVYSYAADERNPEPTVPAGLVAYLASADGPAAATVEVTGSWVELPTGDTVAVVSRDQDRVFAVESGGAWSIVGAKLGDRRPWLGESPRTLLVLGSDARVGQNQLRFRADSIHVLTVVPEEAKGAIVGFPRDSWVEGPNGNLKFSSLMAGRGPEIMLETTRELTGIPVEGYIVTGFKGFAGLIEALGGLVIDLPRVMRSGNNWANFPAGLQKLNPTRALQLARIRKGLPGGDFARSANQGLIMQAAMVMVQDMGIELLPNMLFVLLENAWTDLSTADLLTWAASAYFMAPEDLDNIVLPGRVTTIRGASVVLLDDEVETIFRDLDDGLLDETGGEAP